MPLPSATFSGRGGSPGVNDRKSDWNRGQYRTGSRYDSGAGLGVTGAAIATVIGNIAASAFYLVYFLRKKSSLSIKLKDFKMGERIASGVASIGIPASLNNILMSFANIILNLALVGYGDTPVAAMGVAMKSNMLVVLLQIGLCAGIQPLIGYNYGARNKKRLMQVFRFTVYAP